MNVSHHIFRQYDIRGIAGDDLTAEVAELLGRAVGAEVCERIVDRRPTAVVGMDVRLSSPELAIGLSRGLRRAGVEVIFIGHAPTPLTYWAEIYHGADASLQVTGSHNPPEWNGIKITIGRAAIHGAAIQRIRERIEIGDLPDAEETAPLRQPEGTDEAYIQYAAGKIRMARRVRVVVDAGNGAAGLIIQRLLTAIGADVIPLYCEPDGRFPNHHPDPTVDETLHDLIAQVREQKADLGIAFDGDADRIGVVDENGAIIRGDMLLLLFALDMIERRGKGQTVIFDVKCSEAVPEMIEQAGGVPLMWNTGHSLIKEKMRETGALLAGELSGHIMMADDHIGTDDAPFNACRLIEMVSRMQETLGQRMARLPSYVSTPEIRIDADEKSKFTIVQAALEYFRTRYEVIDVDGARIRMKDGWALLRASNTTPVIIARYEARTEARLAEIRAEVEGWLARHQSQR